VVVVVVTGKGEEGEGRLSGLGDVDGALERRVGEEEGREGMEVEFKRDFPPKGKEGILSAYNAHSTHPSRISRWLASSGKPCHRAPHQRESPIPPSHLAPRV
jgi:hypothetical protein